MALWDWPLPASSLLAGLLGSVAWLGVPVQAAAQSCSTQNGVYTCTVQEGTFTSTIHATAPNPGPNTALSAPMEVTSQGDLQIAVSSSQTVGLLLGATGGDDGSNTGGNTQGIDLANSGSIVLSAGASAIDLTVDAIFVRQTAGSGNPGGASVGVLGGSVPAGITIDNSGQITLDLANLTGQGGAAIWGEDIGGVGFSNQGSSGGDSAGVSISNSGAIAASLMGQGGFVGIGAISRGGAGGSGGSGSNGGAAGPATIANSAAVSVDWAWQDDAQDNDGVFGIAAWAEGGDTSNDSGGAGGAGGAAGLATVTLSGDVSLAVTGTPPGSAPEIPSAGVAAVGLGGDGGDGNDVDPDGGSGGGGGNAAGADIAVTSPDPGPLAVITSGDDLAAVQALLQGGEGGEGGDGDAGSSTSDGGSGGQGGDAGPITISLSGTPASFITVTTAGTTSPGVSAASLGGAGGDGGSANADFFHDANGGVGGVGGAGGDIAVGLTGTSITTTGASSPGIVAWSEGGTGGTGGGATASSGSATTGDGGDGGAAGDVTVTLDGVSGIQTSEADSVGILAQSLSAPGGEGGGGTGGGGSGGQGGAGGDAGNVTVTNDGSIVTEGATARGILVQSLAGAGGSGGSAWGLFHGGGGSGGSAGTTGEVSVTNNGSIVTQGSQAQGVLLQAIGGGGGAGGQGSGPVSTVGGNGVVAGAGGTVDFTATGGSIATSGISGIGVLGQSIGGGGGDGGGAVDGLVTVGGSGAGGGAGGFVSATFDTGSQVGTTGDFAPVVVMQSIGGGGGNAGNAAAGQLFESVAIGGTGGGGGNGGSATIDTNGATIMASGSKSPGLVAQSIGGGGGTGGGAFAGSVGAGFSFSTAVGGTGGSGGASGLAAVTVVGGTIATGQDSLLVTGEGSGQSACASPPCNQLPVDAFGVVVQSIGGGGGHGGSSVAKAVAISIPDDTGGQISLAQSIAVGGTGGTGGQSGNGGDAAGFSLSDGGMITTGGQGSTAVLVQSIGGGGGAGGDSSAFSAVLGYDQSPLPDNPSTLGTTMTFTVGGNGGPGGAGGAVGVALGGTISSDGTFSQDPPGSDPTSIVTFGDYANGVEAQSIGGGGGNAGHGSGNTQAFGTGTSTSFGLTMGSQGGTGGDGGDVTAFLFAGESGITTYGSGAVGLLAHSIGGGGGSSQGGSLSVAQGFKLGSMVTVAPGAKLSLGGTGTNGGSGGDVTVAAASPIVTHGGDATGILAQSIGGGGGLGGSAGSDASADNPVIAALAGREAQSDIESYLGSHSIPQIDATLAFSLGGKGGTGGAGGSVTVFVETGIMTGVPYAAGVQPPTAGDWAHGVVAQSIGGGGGKGGTSVASGTGGISEITINLDYAVGGQGGNGGDGGAVSVTQGSGDTTIGTAGFGAAGVIAQSIGGGGGIGVDGSDSATGLLSVGGATGRDGGSAGNGGTVEFDYGQSGATTIATTGDAADGVVLQSIGGGGGIAGAGSSAFIGAFQQSGTLSLSAGGGSGASGDGGAVTFERGGTGDPTPLSMSTTGDFSFGILAQSIGGGGGSVIAQPSSTSDPSLQIGGSGSSGDGGSVTVTLDVRSSIVTTGAGAHGVVAQSIGEGGGVIRVVDPSGDAPSLGVFPYGDGGSSSNGGGPVSVTVDGTVQASGAGAIGVVAQSIGGGGGLIMNGSSMTAGAPDPTSDAAGGMVTVIVNGAVSATGANGIGIFAQSASSEDSQGVDLIVDGEVTGGGGTPAQPGTPGSSGLQIDTIETVTSTVLLDNDFGRPSLLTTSLGTAGTAIYASSGAVNVSNFGPSTVTGALYLGPGGGCFPSCPTAADTLPTGTLDNRGTYNSGVAVVGNLLNSGLVNLGMPDEVRTTEMTGDFTQTGEGRLGVTIDSVNGAADLLDIDGKATVDGTIEPTVLSLLPGSVEVVRADELEHSAEAQDSLLFDWEVAREDNALSITPNPTFEPSGVGLTASQSSLAHYFGRAWDNADESFALRFAGLAQIDGGRAYTETLDEYSGKDIHAQSIALVNASNAILGASMSCPIFVDESVELGQDDCVWFKATGRWTDQDGTGDVQGYDVSSTGYRIGGQHSIAPDWYLGASFAFGQSWATMDGGSSGSGDTYEGTVALTHTMGPWLFAGSLAVAHGSYEVDRRVDLPGVGETLESDPSIWLVGGRLRAGYQFAFDGWYLRPYGDLDVIYTHLPRVTEDGSSLYALDVASDSKTNVVLSPMVELGGRLELDETLTLRPYAAFGVSWLPDNTRSVDVRFADDGGGNGTFTDHLDAPEVLGRVDVGLQLFTAGGFEAKAGYTADIGGSYLSQSVSGRVAYHF